MDEAEKLITDLEEKRGGHIAWKTVVLFYADSDCNRKDSLFLYRIGNTFWYEDFEKEHTFLGFKVNPPKNYKYVKFEGSFNIDDVETVEKVYKSDVVDFCEGRKQKGTSKNPLRKSCLTFLAARNFFKSSFATSKLRFSKIPFAQKSEAIFTQAVFRSSRNLKKAGTFGAFFKQTVLKINLKNGKQLFMEMLNTKDFRGNLWR